MKVSILSSSSENSLSLLYLSGWYFLANFRYAIFTSLIQVVGLTFKVSKIILKFILMILEGVKDEFWGEENQIFLRKVNRILEESWEEIAAREIFHPIRDYNRKVEGHSGLCYWLVLTKLIHYWKYVPMNKMTILFYTWNYFPDVNHRLSHRIICPT